MTVPAPQHDAPSTETRAPVAGRPLLRLVAPALAARFDALRSRAALRALLVAKLGGVAAAVGVLALAAALLALKLEWARTLGLALAGLAVVVGVIEGFRRWRRVREDDDGAARALGVAAPELASDLLSAVQLSRSVETEQLSRPLVEAHLQRLSTAIAKRDDRRALPTLPLKRALAALALALAAHGLLYGLGGKRLRDAYAFLAFRTAAEKNPLFAPEPIAGDVTLTFKYPAYMHRADKVLTGTAGDILVPKGTTVVLGARADRDIERAFAVVGKEAVALAVAERQLSGQFVVNEPGEWRLRYTKASGRVIAEGPARPVAIEPDRSPEAKLEKPAAELEVEGKETLGLVYGASDDVGLAQIDLVWSLGQGAPEQRKALLTPGELSRREHGDFSWDLSALDLKPGDRVTYRVEAIDGDTVSGPKTGASATQTLKVFSEAEHHREVLKKAEEQWERLVTALADRLEERPAGDKGEHADEAWAKATGEKDTIVTSIANDLKLLAKALILDKRAPPEVGRALATVGDRVGTAVQRTMARRAALMKQPSAGAASAFRTALADEIHEEEKGVLYIEDLMDRRKLLDLADLARELQQGREALTRLVQQFKAAPDEATKQRILGEVARLKERLADIQKRMRELQKGIQDEHLNAEADRLMQGGEDMMGDLDEIQQALSKGDADKALESLDKLQRQLDEMEKKLRKQAGEVDDDTAELTRKLQQMASDLLDLQAEQKGLRDRTESMREREKQARLEKLKALGEKFLKTQEERIRQAREELKGLDPGVAEQLGLAEEIDGADTRLEQLHQALKTNDFEEALQQAHMAVERSEQLQQHLQSESGNPRGGMDAGRLRADNQRVRRAAKPTSEVARDLEKLMEAARPPPTAAERQQMQDLSRQQEALERRTKQFEQEMDKLGQELPIFGPKQQQLLKDATREMQGAKDQLGKGDPRGASGRQQDALRKLKAFKDAMGQPQGQQGGGQGVPMPFGPSPGEEGEGEGGQPGGEGEGMQQEKVEIPGVDSTGRPEAFREELLKAMKDETPEHYRERVRDYYEELVK